MIFWPKKGKDHLLYGKEGKKKHQLMFIIPSNIYPEVHVELCPASYQKVFRAMSYEAKSISEAKFTISMSKVARAIKCYLIFKYRN